MDDNKRKIKQILNHHFWWIVCIIYEHFLNCVPWDLDDPWDIVRHFKTNLFHGQTIWGKNWVKHKQVSVFFTTELLRNVHSLMSTCHSKKGLSVQHIWPRKLPFLIMYVWGQWDMFCAITDTHRLAEISILQWFQIMSYKWLCCNHSGKIIKQFVDLRSLAPTPTTEGRVAET